MRFGPSVLFNTVIPNSAGNPIAPGSLASLERTTLYHLFKKTLFAIHPLAKRRIPRCLKWPLACHTIVIPAEVPDF